MEYDVVIVGAGPAGSSAAWFLSGSGLRVAVIERLSDEKFPEYHRICGGGISRRGASLIPLKEEEILNSVDSIRLRWPGNTVTDIRVKGYVIDRPKLSRRLLEESGAQSIHGSVTDVWLLGDICSITLADGRVIRSRYVIGADGAFSAVRKGVFRTRPEIFTPMEEHISEDPTEDVFEFDIGQEFGGAYRWLFPCGSGRTVGSVSGMVVPDIRERGLHRFIPSGCVPEPVKGNVFLIGDAAGFPNPLTYGGLRTAFESARKATEAIRKGDPSIYSKWQKHSRLFDRRFMELHNAMCVMKDDDLRDFSKAMTHRNLFVNGLCSVIRRPRYTKAYIGCLMAILYGW